MCREMYAHARRWRGRDPERAVVGLEAHVKDLRRILAHHGRRETGAPLGGVRRRISRIDPGDSFGHQPKERHAIVFHESSCGGIELPYRRKGRCAAEHHDGKLRGVGGKRALSAVAIDSVSREGRRAQSSESCS